MKRLFRPLWLFTALCSPVVHAQVYDTNNVVVQNFVGSGFHGHVDGRGELTMFDDPTSVVADSSGNLFVLDRDNEVIRKVLPDGTVTTFAGGGQATPPGYGSGCRGQHLRLGCGKSVGSQDRPEPRCHNGCGNAGSLSQRRWSGYECHVWVGVFDVR